MSKANHGNGENNMVLKPIEYPTCGTEVVVKH